jgi:hypothetical protein
MRAGVPPVRPSLLLVRLFSKSGTSKNIPKLSSRYRSHKLSTSDRASDLTTSDIRMAIMLVLILTGN